MRKTKYIPKITLSDVVKTSRRYIDSNISNDDIEFNRFPIRQDLKEIDILSPDRTRDYPNHLNTSEALLKLIDTGGGSATYQIQPTIIKWDNELESQKPLDEPVFKQNHVNIYPLNIGNQEQIKKRNIKYYKDSLGNYVIKRDNQQNIPYDINTYNIPIKKKQ